MKVKIKSVYGRELIYPVCEEGRMLVSLTGAKTFTRDQLETIKALGFTIEVEQVTLGAWSVAGQYQFKSVEEAEPT